MAPVRRDVAQGDGRRPVAAFSVEDVIMNKNWIGVTTEMSGAVREVRSGAPDVMKGFSMLAQAALKAGALDTKTKELIALAISVATRCDACVGFHAEAAVKQGASRDEIMETMGMAIYMGAGPSVMYAAQAVEAFDQFAEQKARTAA
jgi:AhpD family alkylhydroperoxidase